MKLWIITVMTGYGDYRKVTRQAQDAVTALAEVEVGDDEVITDCVPAEVWT